MSQLSRELRACARAYRRATRKWSKRIPNWKDDEFHDRQYEFVWGYSLSNQTQPYYPSFLSWNDFEIYFNHETQKYVLDVGYLDFITHDEAQVVGRNLLDGLNKMRDFVKPEDDPNSTSYFLPTVWNEADSLPQLYYQTYIHFYGFLKLLGL